MKTTLCIHLHERAIKCLEGIDRCDVYIAASEKHLRNKHVSYYLGVFDFHKNQVAKYTAIKARLLRSYADTIERLIKPAMEATLIAV